MNAVRLDGVGDMDQVLVDHGHKGDVCLRGQVAEDLIEGLDVVGPVVGRQGDAGEQNFDVRGFERGQDLIEVAAGLIERQAAQAVVAAEFYNDDFRMKAQDGEQAGDGIFGGGAAGALVDDLVVVALGVELPLQSVREGLAVWRPWPAVMLSP